MRKEPNIGIEIYREKHPILGGSPGGVNWGFFIVGELCVIASDQMGWDHVSISHKERPPTWDEMHKIKRLWFDDEETVVQFHPKSSEYVNACPTCLHLWRRQDSDHELPPMFLVGPQKGGE